MQNTGEKTLRRLIREVPDDGNGLSYPYTLALDKLLWINRSLAFFCRFLENVCSQPGEVQLADCFTNAYEQTLKK